jgi:hypothetical protein
MMRKFMMVVPIIGLALAGFGLAGCQTAPDTAPDTAPKTEKRSSYPPLDADPVRPNSSIPQHGTDGFVKDD